MKRFNFISTFRSVLQSNLYSIVIPTILVLINLVLKTRYVKHPSLAMDEPFSVYYSQFDITTIITELSYGNNPPLFEIFLHFWTMLFGISEFSVRFPSVMFSSLSVYFLYQICYKYVNLKTAILASVLFTLSNYQLYFAQEARVYSLFMLLTIISFYLYVKLMTLKHSKINITTYIFINTLLLYSHFFSWFVLFVQAISLIIIYRKNMSDLLRFTKYFGVIILLFSPYIKIFIERFLDSSNGTWVAPVKNLRPIHSFYSSLINDTHIGYVLILILSWIVLQKYIIRYFTEKLTKGLLIFLSTAFVLISLSLRLPLVPSYLLPIENEFSSTFEIIAFLLFYLAIFIHFLLNNDRSRHEKIIVSWFFIPAFIMFLSSFYIPMFIDRYLIYCTPPFFIVVAIIVGKLENKLFMSFSLFIIILMTVSFKPISNNKRDVKTLIAKVKKMKSNSRSAVFICPDYFIETFTYYYNNSYFKDIKSQDPYEDMINNLQTEHIYHVKNYKTIDSICNLNKYDKIIYVDAAADFAYSKNNIKAYFNSKIRRISVSVDSTHVPSIFYIYSYKLQN